MKPLPRCMHRNNEIPRTVQLLHEDFQDGSPLCGSPFHNDDRMLWLPANHQLL